MTEDTDLGRITIQGVADLLGVKVETARKYATVVYAEGNPDAQSPFFPRPDGEEFVRAEIEQWMSARKGPGGGKGAVHSRGLYACQRCGDGVKRRWRDEFSGDYLCKPCVRSQARARTERVQVYALRTLRSSSQRIFDAALVAHIRRCDRVRIEWASVREETADGFPVARFDVLAVCPHERTEWWWVKPVDDVRLVLVGPKRRQKARREAGE